MALQVHPKQMVPTEDYEDLEELPNFERACDTRHNDVGRPLAALSQEDIMRGYFMITDKHAIPNLWRAPEEAGERQTINQSYADEVSINDPFDPWTVLVMKNDGRVSTIDDMCEEFCPWASLPAKAKDVWNLDGLDFRKKDPDASPRPAKRKRSAKSNDQQSVRPTALSQVLQNRLTSKQAPPKNGA